jgi:hypothetical protein
MRIDNALPSYFHMPQTVVPARQVMFTEPAGNERTAWFNSPAASVEISPQALAAHTQCETCDSRRYVDQSDDPSVSFQTPTHISPGQSAAMVLAHEREHVSSEQARADREGREVISQTISLQVSNCPECNRMYVSGGSTRTLTVSNSGNQEAENLATLLDMTI